MAVTTYEDVKAAWERLGRTLEAMDRASQQPTSVTMDDAEYNVEVALGSLERKIARWMEARP